MTLFPAHAGVIPYRSKAILRSTPFPRLRGGFTLTTLRKKQIIGLS